MANKSWIINKLHTLFILLLIHLGCFVLAAKAKHHNQQRSKKANILSSSWSYLKRILPNSKTFKKTTATTIFHTHPATPSPTSTTLTSARSSQHSLISLVQSYDHEYPSSQEISVEDDQFLPLRKDIFPCTACGEIFEKAQFLEEHESINHAVTELLDGDTSKQIVNIIFKSGWSCNREQRQTPEIQRILKIHNSRKILTKFEEYREFVKAKAARKRGSRIIIQGNEERCIADGNEVLRFLFSTFTCDLGENGKSSICNQEYCSVCGILKSGISQKLDGISTRSTSYGAHLTLPQDIEEDFKFMNVKRAMLVCRVIAGRVGSDSGEEKEDGGPDSVLGRGGINGVHTGLDEEELLVFNPYAALPCFMIVYSATTTTA